MTDTVKFVWQHFVLGERRLPPSLALFALELSVWANADGTSIRPGAELLASRRGLSVRQVWRNLEDLRAFLGLIDLVKRGGGQGRREANEYRLTLPNPDAWDAVVESWLQIRLTRRCQPKPAHSTDTLASHETDGDEVSTDTGGELRLTPAAHSTDTLASPHHADTPAIDHEGGGKTATERHTRASTDKTEAHADDDAGPLAQALAANGVSWAPGRTSDS